MEQSKLQIYSKILLLSVFGLVSSYAHADDEKRHELTVGLTSLGKDEKNTYGNLRVTLFSSETSAWDVTATLSQKKTFVGSGFTIRYGGNDYEIRSMHKIAENTYFAVGFAVANTPAGKDRVAITFSGSSRAFGTDKANLALVVKCAARFDSTQIGTGARLNLSMDKLDFFAEGLWINGSQNTYNTVTGKAEIRPVYRVGIRPKLSSAYRLELGLTNALGRTTGMSLTPGLGKGLGGYFEISVRF
jgi:hypothetical protein